MEPTPQPDDRAQRRYKALMAAIARLPEWAQQVLFLARIQRLQLSEVAKQMGLTEAATSMLLYRSMRRLKDEFRDDEDADDTDDDNNDLGGSLALLPKWGPGPPSLGARATPPS